MYNQCDVNQQVVIMLTYGNSYLQPKTTIDVKIYFCKSNLKFYGISDFHVHTLNDQKFFLQII